ncbi:MAG TPA: ammonia-forming cytochrome c nitrite reductase subunit c552 [Polyangiaceae bacterium LLY-WYZ-15_(1-7)]|nr:hypothetical protein [Myxococcales bacterium]MAT28979.1 hypothetical protein [Sandaracinus sp.]HJL05258.1 ammonia-forming cytochrome c nitrite reductase subunit c552 [Polyangiaceae bacterium LLY-WYZ-15_(1-7)]HJL07448.1 ammonia-forming cytochrome c nitrite reductase subunit c552 [Polyangiaceae bacterium LLY-WYZ-15_(1-7)]HJL27165.1 ammonia-forming cytochrome c nitrite reductase subunit c552 [Polyangiaceae bacterium LLY-WYZ-15_(1-7)]
MSGRRALWALAGAAIALGLGGWRWGRAQAELGRERDLHAVGYAGSDACRRCHGDHWESWRRTHHGRMTQEATAESVLGAFDGRSLAYFGWTARFERDEAGHWVVVESPEGAVERMRVDRTVGSRRVQQYLARRDGSAGTTWWRLPVAWHVEEQRWMHMNGAFLTPDPDAAPASRADFERHVVRWNDNCVFCHNVAPNPGRGPDGGFETEVAELGVACEACHGPGADHVAENADPLRRYLLHYDVAEADPTAVSPAALDPARRADVCGRCHGQRLTGEIDRFLAEGDPFVPGDDLALYSEPLWRDTPLNGEEGVFAARFWPDGTPRLTAYEYQGWQQSPCSVRGPASGRMSCTSCHGMHEGDPRGQLRPEAEGDGACRGCHGSSAIPASHARHETVACVDCHMPRVVYGLIGAHRSHRVESPDPARQARSGRPDACTLCHVGESRAWAARETARLWPGASAPLDLEPGAVHAPSPDQDAMEERQPEDVIANDTAAEDIAANDMAAEDTAAEDTADTDDPSQATLATPTAGAREEPELERMLFGGDPIERALAADALGRSPLADPARRAGLLLDVLAADPYPAVRRIAFRQLAAEHDLPWAAFDPTGTPTARRAQVAALAATLPHVPPDPARVATLRAQAAHHAIHIGE